jgi:hypothetical protein
MRTVLTGVVVALSILSCGDSTEPPSATSASGGSVAPGAGGTGWLDAGKGGSVGSGGGASTGGATGAGGSAKSGGTSGSGGTSSSAGGGGASADGGTGGSIATGGHAGGGTDAAPPGDGGARGTYSLACDGTGYATVQPRADLEITGDWTIEAWFYDDDPAPPYNHVWRYVVSKGDARNAPYLLGTHDGLLQGGQVSEWAGEYAQYDLKGNSYPRQWLHGAMAFTAATKSVNVYVNGQLKATTTLAKTALSASSVRATICGLDTGWWIGKVDDVRIWNIARPAAYILVDYPSQLTTAPAGLVANWTFEEGSGSTVHDVTGHGHDGTIVGGATFSTEVHP